MKHLRTAVRSLAGIAAIWLVLMAAAGVVAGEMALHPMRRVEGPAEQELALRLAARHGAELADVSIPAADGAVLRAWSMRPAAANGDAVILLHGVSDNRGGMLDAADMLLGHGYAVLLPDARANGMSGGPIDTYGVLEADDIRRWYDWLQRTDTPRCIDGLGDSMGAAELLESLTTVSGFCAVVAESPFANFHEASYDRLGQQFNEGAGLGRTLLRPASTMGLLYVRWKYGVDLAQASPETAVAASSVPVLLIHGKRDTNLPPRHSEAIFARSRGRGAAVQLWEPAEAGHCGAAQAEPEEYERRVIAWFANHDRR
jgi:hypothetical protein